MFLSVALCTYNGEFFLEQQLNSIFEQTILVNEIVICDDGSSDKTRDLLKTYEKKFPNIIKLLINDVTLGTIKNFEKAISLTNGDLIFLADQDDVWHKDKVEIMVNFFQENINCKLLFTDGDLIDEIGGNLKATLWEKWNFRADMQNKWENNENAFKDLVVNNNKITGATVCFHSSLKEYILPIEIPNGYWHDSWLGLHAAANGGLMFLEKNLIKYRIHKNQQVGISNNVNDIVSINANKQFITKETYFKKIIKIYPALRKNVPLTPKSNIKKIILKIKNYLKSFSN
ncbi:MAG: glycosyltransferase family 2 protein [Flavobacterium sp.]|nr:glycosyltransferase family 2 protein [Flavobacterium sp.]